MIENEAPKMTDYNDDSTGRSLEAYNIDEVRVLIVGRRRNRRPVRRSGSITLLEPRKAYEQFLEAEGDDDE